MSEEAPKEVVDKAVGKLRPWLDLYDQKSISRHNLEQLLSGYVIGLLSTSLDMENARFLERLKRLCDEYDAHTGLFPESRLEGEAIYKWAMAHD